MSTKDDFCGVDVQSQEDGSRNLSAFTCHHCQKIYYGPIAWKTASHKPDCPLRAQLADTDRKFGERKGWV